MDGSHRSAGHMSMADLSTSHLFEKYTVEEIRKLERETRADIEKKKEDLRQMVGERYRDLIEAADTITDMKNCAEKIVVSIQDMQKHCVNLQKTHFTKGISISPKKAGNSGSQSSGFYAIASQTKLLLDIPEKIWSDIESGEHLHATQLYLLACHIVSSLQLDTTTHQSAQLLKWFPVLSRQWAAICHFKPSILQSCRNVLKNADAPDEEIAKSLCAIMLLEDTSPRQVFTEFLLARKNAVHQAFSSPQFDTSVKRQVCGVTNLINLTLRQIHAVFYHQENEGEDDEKSNLLLSVLNKVTQSGDGQTVLAEELAVGTFSKHLPSHITEFHPKLRAAATPIAASFVQESVSQWVETCISDVHDGISKLLGYVTSIRGLTSIRDAVWDLLQEAEDDIPLNTVAKRVLGRTLCLWGEFVRPLFLTRIQAIIQESLDQTLTNSHQLVIQASRETDSSPADLDVASHTWTELASDVPSPLAWQAGPSTKDVLDAGSLYMKARAFTPKTQSICSFIDVRLKSLLEDLGCYADKQTDRQTDRPQQQQQSDKQTATSRGAQGPFDKYADTTSLHSFLQIACTQCVNRLIEHIKQELTDCKGALDVAHEANLEEQAIGTINRVVFLGRLCSALTELSPHLQQAVLITEKRDRRSEQQRIRTKIATKRDSKSSSTDDEWSKSKAGFLSQSNEAYKLWSRYTCTSLLAEFKDNLTDTSPSALLKNSTAWDSIDIEEETEDGKKVSSKIRLPVQSSWYVQSLLYGLCEEINRVGGHALSSSLVSELVRATGDGLLHTYQTILKGKSPRGRDASRRLTQPQALQLLFDIRFIGSIMLGRGEDKKDQARFNDLLHGLMDTLEGFVDPFDLDVFTPHMTSNLNRHAHRCSLLLGFLTSPEKHLFSSQRSSAAGYQEQHNVLPLSSPQVRFSLLPLSTASSQTSKLTLQPALARQKQPQVSSMATPSPMDAILHKSRSSPASLSSRLSSSLKSGWLSNLGGQS
ncbi:conserved oligomeric Golgi complex subunit 1-like [Diadema antillarum]|uniref:conserved oligomeric Golgi complex subunit 1-like n=1 Tax=Diadema antillarum TaxID=105358 RepID=UPI003A8C55C2